MSGLFPVLHTFRIDLKGCLAILNTSSTDRQNGTTGSARKLDRTETALRHTDRETDREGGRERKKEREREREPKRNRDILIPLRDIERRRHKTLLCPKNSCGGSKDVIYHFLQAMNFQTSAQKVQSVSHPGWGKTIVPFPRMLPLFTQRSLLSKEIMTHLLAKFGPVFGIVCHWYWAFGNRHLWVI